MPHRTSSQVSTISQGGQSTLGNMNMNLDRIEGNWKQLKGNIQQQWGKLTCNQLDVVLGKRQRIAGRLQEIYGIVKDENNSRKNVNKQIEQAG